ncbi:OmpA family protein [Uliginosibacterium sp. H3]|uniref:OmpA family protein n=1 Tax=Uliginosibacterium silvisoli TaxID=3114758 RepID=A0ABU6K055_9RHOO|nr:OmpA family protein [Uliginosibacterium sp. H3]
MAARPAWLLRTVQGLAMALALLWLAGCASTPKSYVLLLPSPDGTVGKVIVTGANGEQVLDKAGQAASTDGRAIAVPPPQVQLDKDFSTTIAARPKLPVNYLLYFTTGTTLTSESQAQIPRIIADATSRSSIDISVIGHTDTIMTAEYNEQLALSRANAVVELLKSRGLNASAISVESHGKRNLLIQTPDNTFEPRNRRVEVSIR